jgi:uncharacterized protein (TIGR02271 family)
MTDTIVVVYKTPAQAESAVQDLLAANVPASAIDRHMAGGSYHGGSSSLEARPAESKGFWASLFGDESHENADIYDDSMTYGNSVVTVRGISDADYDSVAALLERHDPVDVDDSMRRDGGGETVTTESYGATPVVPKPVAGADADEAALSLSEERLAVGKRVVNRGSMRIRRYVVEMPAEEDVLLRDEKVRVERRPVTGTSAVPDSAFTDKVIEMTASGEEAVVGKTAHVVEEISLRKEAVDRTETIRDTVRKEEVEIEQAPTEEPVPDASTAAMRKP